jgi:putative Holliday junction resolvase
MTEKKRTQIEGLTPPSTLALDVGLKRIGVAVSRLTLAEPLDIIEFTSAWDGQSLVSESVWLAVESCIDRYAIKQLIVGESEGESAMAAREFAAQLHARAHLPVQMVDETLSTQAARAKLAWRSSRPRRVDHFAAAELLQEWLDSGEWQYENADEGGLRKNLQKP